MNTIRVDMRMWNLKENDTDDRVRWQSLIELGARLNPAT